MTYIVPKTEIEVENVEARTSKNGDKYFLITDALGENYGDWREGREVEGAFPLTVGTKYLIEYTSNGKYKNDKSAWIKEAK
jgi:hypothetical protein